MVQVIERVAGRQKPGITNGQSGYYNSGHF